MKGVIINQDTDGIFWGFRDKLPTLEEIKDFPKEFAGTHVTDYFINIASETVTYPSEKHTDILEKYYRKEENGMPVDYSEDMNGKAAKYVFEELGVDHNQLLIEGFREVGINPWISFRMNDFHDKNLPTSFGFSDFYYEHPEYRRVKFHPEFMVNCGDNSFDYYYDEVREFYLGIIDEGLDRYDAYGIELDFQREIEVFGFGRHYVGIEIMNDFMRKVDALTHKYEEKYGHQIKVAVRVAPDIQTNFDFGHDVMQWVREGIVDMVIPTGRYESSDMEMPIKLWSNLLKPYNVELTAGAEQGIRPHYAHRNVWRNIETYAAFCANAYEQGADKVYFYNYFRRRADQRFDREAPFVTDPNVNCESLPVYWTVINTMGDPEAVQKLNRRHIITCKDRFPFWNHCGGDGRQLPVETDRTISFKISVGEIPEDADVIVHIGIVDGDKLKEAPRLFINSEPAEYLGCEYNERYSNESVLLAYRVPKDVRGLKVICPFVITKEPIDIRYVDAHVIVN
ncbi:MAG: hypothetical protein IJY93_02270 [Clostridia bacterium]|nr:hypothetical protein [Clostridia bacterium]